VTVRYPRFLAGWKVEKLGHATAIFRQVNKHDPRVHHDALEFSDGRIVLLTRLSEGQEATVLQLPAQPTTAAEADAQRSTFAMPARSSTPLRHSRMARTAG
jgi:hypothetical protein